jgi:DNA sulfur modification protein DndD
MILQELRLHNFGVYRGEQVLNLAPSRRAGSHAPIILFGGINGGGKTTILDAVQLTLYGPRAQCTKRSNRSYESFLSESIHHGVPSREGAAVGLRFSYASEGEQHEYEVRRTWTVRDERTRETLHVSKDGVRDRWLSENWNQVVEDLIPLGISQLFFFDAEKIRFLAEDDTTGEALSTAVKALLGLDLAERLIADTNVLENRLANNAKAGNQDPEIAELEASLAKLDEGIRRLKEQRAALENDVLRSQRDVKRADEEFAGLGGRHWEERDSRKRRLRQLEDRQTELNTQLQTFAAAELPFALVSELLVQGIQEQDAAEQRAIEARLAHRLLITRDEQMLSDLRERGVSKRALDHIQAWQAADRESRAPADESLRLHLSENGRHLLQHLRCSLPLRVDDVVQLLEQLDDVRHESDDLQRSLAAVSPDSEIQPALNRMKAAAQTAALIDAEVKRLDQEIASTRLQRDDCDVRLTKIRRSQLEREIANEEHSRMACLVDRTRHTIGAFLKRATESKIERLSRFVTESFRFLLRKTTLVERIQIDPSSFRIALFDAAGRTILKERLSEGEKQIFAISLLWGLARASARPLPAIVDTPMARLDAMHRDYLIERYFPNASHQVIVLSTDTEVDRRYYEQLQPHIARAYHLNYEDIGRCTVAEEGYFWSANGASVAGRASQ